MRFLTYGENQYAAKVVKILPTADPATQRNVVHLEVEIAPEKLVPGITGEVVIEVGEHEHTLIVPRRAVFGTNLYAVNDGRIEFRTRRRDAEVNFDGLLRLPFNADFLVRVFPRVRE